MAGEAPKPPPRAFQCPSCGGAVGVRAQGLTVVVTCQSCGSLIDAQDENHKLLSVAQKNIRVPLIPIGQRGTLRGIKWEVIGYMVRSDPKERWKWEEYLLFDLAQGFRWLTCFDGHWNYVVMTKSKPTGKSFDRDLSFLGREFKLFHSGHAKVLYVLGEFYWRVAVGETVTVGDYISPSEMLSFEKSADVIVWSVGDYLEPKDVAKAFAIQEKMPQPNGVAPNQPSAYHSYADDVLKYWGIALALLVVLQLGYAMGCASNTQILRKTYSFSTDPLQKMHVSESFKLDKVTNLELYLRAPVSNTWFGIEVDLVNEYTGETLEFDHGVEFYSGYDDGESWAEGQQAATKTISSVPKGKYHLNITPQGPPEMQGKSFDLSLSRDVLSWSNFLWSALLLSIFPAFVMWRRRSFEVNRWSTSDFSPYWTDDE